MFSHFLIIMIVEGLLQGGLRPPWPPAAAQGLSRSRGRGVHDKTEATWFIKCCILKKLGSQSSLMKGLSCLWAIITCIFKLLFLENFLSQNSHSKCFFFYEQKQHGSKSYSFSKTMVTKFTFERLFLLMNHTNMYIQVTFLERFLSQNSHSKCFFFSWTEATWFKLLFLENNGYKVHIWKAFLVNRSNMSIQFIWKNKKNSKNHSTNLPPLKKCIN